MNVIVDIDGENAIPVRAIPFLTNWATMSPDVVSDALAGKAHQFRGLSSFRFEGTIPKKVMATWWENFPCRQLKALSEEIKSRETTHETGYQEWRSRSIQLLPAGVFVWQDQFVYCHTNRYGPSSTTFLTERGAIPRDEHERRIALDFDPFIPEPHTQHIVMEGFPQPDPKTSPVVDDQRVIPAELLGTQIVVLKSQPASVLFRPEKNDLLWPAISAAQKQCDDPYDAPAVWARLRERAVQSSSPFVGVTEDGLQWIDNNDDTKYLSLKQLRDRLSRQKRKATKLA